VARPREFPYAVLAVDDLPVLWREFVDSLRRRAGGQWVAEIYRRPRGASAELAPPQRGACRGYCGRLRTEEVTADEVADVAASARAAKTAAVAGGSGGSP